MNHTEARIALDEINKAIEAETDHEEIEHLSEQAEVAEAALLLPTRATATFDENDMAWLTLTDRELTRLHGELDGEAVQLGNDRYFDLCDKLSEDLFFLWAHEARKEDMRWADAEFERGFNGDH